MDWLPMRGYGAFFFLLDMIVKGGDASGRFRNIGSYDCFWDFDRFNNVQQRKQIIPRVH